MSKISTKNIVQAIYDMTRGKTGRELELVINKVIFFLKTKRLIGQSAEILKKLKQKINKEEGIVETKLTVRKDLPTEKLVKVEAVLKKRYTAKHIVMTVKEDESVLGGMRIEVGDEVIDMTYRNKIDQLQNFLIKN